MASPVVSATLARRLLDRRKHLLDLRRLEFLDRLRLDLPDPLAGDREALADLLERARLVLSDAEPQPDHRLLARRERAQNAIQLARELRPVNVGVRGDR